MTNEEKKIVEDFRAKLRGLSYCYDFDAGERACRIAATYSEGIETEEAKLALLAAFREKFPAAGKRAVQVFCRALRGGFIR